MLATDACGAVSRDGVIPPRLRSQCIEGTHIFEEPLASSVRRSREVVKVDVLVPIVGTQADHVALISDEVDECILTVEAADSGISLADGLPRLDGEAERRRVCELKTNDGVRNPRRSPVIDCQVDAGDLREPHSARLPVRSVICVGAIIAIANIMKSKFIAVDVRPCQLRHIRLPIAVIARLECEPPAKHATEKQCDDGYFAPEVPDEYERERNRYRQQSSYNLVCIAEWSVIPRGAEGPNG